MLIEMIKRIARSTSNLFFCQAGDNLGEGVGEGEGQGQSGASQEGEGEGNQGGGQGQEGSGEGNQGGEGSGAEGEGAGEGEGQGESGGSQSGEGEGSGQFGGFNTLEELVSAHNNQTNEFNTLKGKQTATETNLATTRSSLKRANLVMDENGNITMQKKTEARQQKFTDQHATLFDKPVLEALRFLIEDFYGDQQDKSNKQASQDQQAFNERQEAVDLMFGYFPQLKHPDLGGQEFNQDFHDATMALYANNYRHLPNGELVAALKVAQQLNVPAKQIAAAKKEGFKQGQGNRKVISKVGGQHGKSNQGTGGFQKVSKAEYLKKSPEDREKYRQAELESKK